MADQEDRRLLMTARATFDFTGTEALVTGGTSGIGHATATLFRDAGATVTVTGTKAGPGDYDTDLTGMTYRRLVLTDTQLDRRVGLGDKHTRCSGQQCRSQLPRRAQRSRARRVRGLGGAQPHGALPVDRRTAEGAGRVHRPRRCQRGLPFVIVGAAGGHHGARLRRGQGRHRQPSRTTSRSSGRRATSVSMRWCPASSTRR